MRCRTDPLTTVEGVESIVANYRSLAAISSSAELLVLTAKFDKDGDGQQVLKFDAQANYAVRWTPFQIHIRSGPQRLRPPRPAPAPGPCTQPSSLVTDRPQRPHASLPLGVADAPCARGPPARRQLSEVTFDKDHLITRHVDHWSVESILTAIPIIGFLYACIFRPLVGIVISVRPRPRAAPATRPPGRARRPTVPADRLRAVCACPACGRVAVQGPPPQGPRPGPPLPRPAPRPPALPRAA